MMMKRILTAMLAVCVTVTSVGLETLAANGESTVSEEAVQEPEAETETEALEAEPEGEEKALVNYILVEKSRLETPDIQKVVASIGEAGEVPENPVLIYKNKTTGETFQTAADNMVQDMALFSMKFEDTSKNGEYELVSVGYSVAGKERRVSLAELGMQVGFGVNTEVEVQPDEVIYNEEVLKEVEANVVTMDGDGNVVSDTKVENVLENAEAQLPAAVGSAMPQTSQSKAKNLIVMLDPGHDGTHAGAQYAGYGEEDLVLKIAKYCRDELKQYAGVTVYMTRETDKCPNGGSSVDSGTCNAKRVELAVAKKANVYVSFHLNASASGSANGVGVYYPNGNYRPDLGEEGQELAKEIYDKLRALGLAKWADGILIHNSEDGTTYPDGSLADYLGIIRRNKLAGIPAVLIEHAFLSSSSDVDKFLSSNSKLKKLGVADAKAIVSYYGLKKKEIVPVVIAPVVTYVQAQAGGKLKIAWEKQEDVTGYCVYRSTAKDKGYSQIANIGDVTEYIDTEVTPGKTYYYKVSAIHKTGAVSEYSAVTGGKAVAAPVLNYIKSSSTGKLEINWKAAAGADGYQIYRSTSEKGTYKAIKTITSGKTTGYTDSVEKNNTKYYYKVRAYNSNEGKKGYGSYSSVKYGKTLAKAQAQAVTGVNDKSIKVLWKKVSGANGYIVYRSTQKSGKYTKIATIKSGETTGYTDKKIKAGSEYFYKIKAYNVISKHNGYGTASNAISGSTLTKTSITGIKSVSSGQLEIKWKEVGGAYGYRVKRSTSSKGKYTVIATIKGKKNTTCRDKKAQAGKRYYYTVEVINRVNGVKGYSGDSKAVAGRALAKTAVSLKAYDSEKIQISWDKVTGAGGYQIQRSGSKSTGYKTIANLDGTAVTTYKDTSAKPGKTYYYRVRAYKKSKIGTGYASYSVVKKTQTLAKGEITAVSSKVGDTVTLEWKGAKGAEGYKLLRSTESAKKGFKTVAAANSKTLKYTDNTVEPGQTYYYKVQAFTKKNGITETGSYSVVKEVFTMAVPALNTVKYADGNALSVSWKKVGQAEGYQLQRSDKSGSGYKTVAKLSENKYKDTKVESARNYYYRVRSYGKLADGTRVYSGWSKVKSGLTAYAIMGKTGLSVDKMVKYYDAKFNYDPDFYGTKGAPTSRDFFSILTEEAEAEGICAEVVYAQVILETGGLSFQGDVDKEQCNFAGIGATGGGVKGNTFPDVRTGLRAQIQHLKAYASDKPLENKCVDPRFQYVTRMTAPYVEWLGIPKNPYGKGWAADPDYADKLLKIIYASKLM